MRFIIEHKTHGYLKNSNQHTNFTEKFTKELQEALLFNSEKGAIASINSITNIGYLAPQHQTTESISGKNATYDRGQLRILPVSIVIS